MLQHLSVKNYALIDQLDLVLHQGFSVITGETGAGKSIILGALGLILGKRADLKAIGNKEEKCIVEGSFKLNTAFNNFFETHDLDFEANTLIRREITPSGKSRAFINDTPVTLEVLSQLSSRLIDVHSQHQNLILHDNIFQLELLDNFAKNNSEKEAYITAFKSYNKIKIELENLIQLTEKEEGDSDYLQFLFNELQEAKLEPEEQEELEKELELLENAGDIISKLSEATELLNGDHQNILSKLKYAQSAISSIARFDDDFESIAQRLNSCRIELDDIHNELSQKSDHSEFDPNRAEQLELRLSSLLSLQKKHHVMSVEALIHKKNEIENKLKTLFDTEEKIDNLRVQLAKAKFNLQEKADILHLSRKAVVAGLENKIKAVLKLLNMPSANFIIDLQQHQSFNIQGGNSIDFLFSANKGLEAYKLSKVASGGELSRVMLAIKATMAETKNLPSIIFDEIDSGVSGETAGKIGEILKKMGSDMQVLAISHLPQIASMGKYHYKVLKKDTAQKTVTHIELLKDEQRVKELARLLSGEKISEAALENARTLLAQY